LPSHDSGFCTSRGTQLQEGNGNYIVSYFDDDDDDDVEKEEHIGGGGGGSSKAEMIPIIIKTTGTNSRSFRKYLSNIPGKHEIKEVQKRRKTAILDNAHIRH